jgi:hypothetical protein
MIDPVINGVSGESHPTVPNSPYYRWHGTLLDKELRAIER